MQAPLAHYFIFTSHNSYLTGNQLSSDCSEVPIIAALKKGVKVIELDLWPNDREDGVEVRHGGYEVSFTFVPITFGIGSLHFILRFILYIYPFWSALDLIIQLRTLEYPNHKFADNIINWVILRTYLHLHYLNSKIWFIMFKF